MRSMQRVAGFLVGAVVSGALLLGSASLAVADQKGKGHEAHKHFKGEVIEKGAGELAIKTEAGATYQLSENEARRQGRQFKAGDKVEVTVIDLHKGKHVGQKK